LRDFGPVEKLRAEHDLAGFDCGVPALNHFLARHSLASQQGHNAQTYVVTSTGRVVAYYTLTAGSVGHAGATERARKGQPRHPIPVAILARLAVCCSAQGHGLGAGLLKDALLRVAGAADTIGIRAVLVHAKDDAARAFYEHFGFESSPTDAMHLMLIMKDIRVLLR
jgi:GNAT superfamily N-acetyltransferase